MPVFNEHETVLQVIEKVAAVPFDIEIIIVDDGSTDGTREILEKLDRNDTRAFFHEKNGGKGSAVRTGFQHVTGDYVLIQDADLEYTPDDYPVLLKPLIEGNADVVFGSRFQGGIHRCHLFWHYVVNKLLTLLSNMMTNLNLTDMETCFKAFKVDVVRKLHLKSNRFGIEPEMTAKVARMGCRIYEVPVSYYGRDYSEGKKINWKDGLSAIWSILRFNLFDRGI